MSDAADLDRLCAAAGLERVYHDQFGVRHEVSPETIRAVAKALGLAEAGLGPPPMLEPATILRADGGGADVSVVVPTDRSEPALRWKLIEEDGKRGEGKASIDGLRLLERIGDGAHERRALPLPGPLAPGYHRLAVALGAQRAEMQLIAAPPRAYMPDALAHGPGIWGLAAQLYSLRSARDWGMGDFGSLAALIPRAAAAGAAAVGVNPLHALMLDEPTRASPYSPSSRAYLNPLYIEIEAVAEFEQSDELRQLVRAVEFKDRLERLRALPLVDYDGVAALKLRALHMLYEAFREQHIGHETPRARDFAAFKEKEGEPLRRFCIFQVLRESRGAAEPAQRDWRNWPRELADPGSPVVAAFAAENAARVDFYAYCQWIARGQLSACAAAARASGMPLGLYCDIAVGVDAAAGEAWAMQDVIVPGWSIGAPPDDWNRRGQDWGLSPVSPVALRRKAYRPFIELLRHNMRDVGALRIDHILGLWRTFWIRHGASPAEGAYVRNPFEDLMAIVALESQRARCVVIGEDLGTVPPGLREALHEAGILSYRLLYFEHRQDGQRARPQDYPRLALVAVGTHDLPPLAGFWSGADIDVRRALGHLHSDDDVNRERGRRTGDREALKHLWREAGLDAEEAPPILAAHRFLARSPGRILMVQVEDALGLIESVNVPGTVDEHPNWRRRLPIPVEKLFEDERVRALTAALNEERPPRRLS